MTKCKIFSLYQSAIHFQIRIWTELILNTVVLFDASFECSFKQRNIFVTLYKLLTVKVKDILNIFTMYSRGGIPLGNEILISMALE